MMDAYFVRVYTMKDGSKIVPNAIYALSEQAEAELGIFCPTAPATKDEEPELDLSEVAFVQIEKRYSPTPIWFEVL